MSCLKNNAHHRGLMKCQNHNTMFFQLFMHYKHMSLTAIESSIMFLNKKRKLFQTQVYYSSKRWLCTIDLKEENKPCQREKWTNYMHKKQRTSPSHSLLLQLSWQFCSLVQHTSFISNSEEETTENTAFWQGIEKEPHLTLTERQSTPKD